MTYGRHPNHETVPCYHNITSFNGSHLLPRGRWMVEPTGVCGRKMKNIQPFFSVFTVFSTVLPNFIVEAGEKKTNFIFRTLTYLFIGQNPAPDLLAVHFFLFTKIVIPYQTKLCQQKFSSVKIFLTSHSVNYARQSFV